MLSILDNVVIVFYFIGIFALAIWVTLKDKQRGSKDYFLASKEMGWFIIGASLFASNIGAEHIIGLSGSGARGDMPAAQFEILASIVLMVLGWLFVPFYLKSGVFTMPEFLEKRYAPGARTYLSIVSILAYVLTKISLTIFAGALVFEVMGIPFWTGALIVVISTGLYTIFGGFKAVLYTDMVQLFILLGGMILVVFFGFKALGGWEGMIEAVNATAPGQDKTASQFINLWRAGDDSDYPWTGLMFGAPILGVWYWCTDQFIVQRVLSAKDVSNARKGTLFAGFLKQLPILLFVIPGVIAFALAGQGLLNLDIANPDKALPVLISDILPTGIRGLVLAGLLAALMSSLSSAFNSSSTLFTIDFYKKLKPKAKERELVWVGQLATIILVIISLAYIPLMRVFAESEGIIQYMQSVQAYISPPIAAAFLFGLFFYRINGFGALVSLWTGFILGGLRFVLELVVSSGNEVLASNNFVNWYISINFLHFALYLFIVSAIILYTSSLLKPAPEEQQINGLTFSKIGKGFFETKRIDVLLTSLLFIIVIIIWIIFSPLGIA